MGVTDIALQVNATHVSRTRIVDDLRKTLNEYLFYEFGLDLEQNVSALSERWPFELREVGRSAELVVYEFADDREYFAIAGDSLSFLPKAGMTFDDLQLQSSGASWISARDPIDLSMSKPGDDTVPSGLERRRSLEELAKSAVAPRAVEILEGLFLRTERRYLALVRAVGESNAIVAGLQNSPQLIVGFPDASSWRRLAWAVGRWIQNSGAAGRAG